MPGRGASRTRATARSTASPRLGSPRYPDSTARVRGMAPRSATPSMISSTQSSPTTRPRQAP